jgi:hypothetical protein
MRLIIVGDNQSVFVLWHGPPRVGKGFPEAINRMVHDSAEEILAGDRRGSRIEDKEVIIGG